MEKSPKVEEFRRNRFYLSDPLIKKGYSVADEVIGSPSSQYVNDAVIEHVQECPQLLGEESIVVPPEAATGFIYGSSNTMSVLACIQAIEFIEAKLFHEHVTT